MKGFSIVGSSTTGSALFGMALSLTAPVCAEDLASTAPPEDASVRIVSPSDGATVPGSFQVVFELSGMDVAPAGTEKEGTGHHHLLVDTAALPPANAPMGTPPLHFGGGQTETVLELEPGRHTLQLVLGDHLHVPFDPPVVSDVVTVTVE